MPKSNGPNDAIQVLIFPASMKGTGEGDRPWDAKPNTDMTNATVSNAVKAVDGHTITLTYQGKEKTITIADATPIVTLAPATKDDLKPGAGVIVTGEKAADGSVSASQVAVGLNGIIRRCKPAASKRRGGALRWCQALAPTGRPAPGSLPVAPANAMCAD